MLFSSLHFLYLFFPACIILYSIGHENRWRNAVLIAFSLLFYVSGEPTLIVVLLIGFVHNYAFALLIENAVTQRARGALLAVSVAMNLSTLIFFKYYNFIADNLNSMLGLFGIGWAALPHSSIPLPLGISFYTFQIMGYVIDVYRRTTEAQRSPAKLLMYEVSFHQLVAGPIVRYQDIAAEIEKRELSVARFSMGVTRFLAGLGKKTFFANNCGALCAQFLGRDPSTLSAAGALIGIVMFALQIYFDFSGYSDMAIGMGHMFGFTYRENFDYPYIAKTVTEFWRRWHMSLGTFFRDYVYIPLGGNRRKYLRNLAVVWLLTGLWHGASWNFVLWGAYFAVLIAAEKLFLAKLISRLPKPAAAFVSRFYLLAAALIGWSVFYYTDIGAIAAFMGALFGKGAGGWVDVDVAPFLWSNGAFAALAILAATPIFKLACARIREAAGKSPHADAVFHSVLTPLYNLGVLALSTIMLAGDSFNPFLYFRF